jgi:hypothetical protein
VRITTLNLAWAARAIFLLTFVALGVYPSFSSAAGCPNEAFRIGPSAALPDCRAYELVTPPDTNGRLVGAINTFGTPPLIGRFPTEHASPSGSSFAYMTYVSPLLNPGGANGNTDTYQAVRTEAGWVTSRRITPAGAEATLPIPGGVASDHLYASVNVGGTLSSMALGGDTDYLANPDGTYELIGVGELGSEPFAQTRWISDGGEHVIFTTGHEPEESIWCFQASSDCKVQQLEPEAPPTGTAAIYDRSADGPTELVSLLPGDIPPGAGQHAVYKGQSEDGATVAFVLEGTLYVRVDEPAETLVVDTGKPTFAGLSDDGRYLFYVETGNIHRFDTVTAEDDQVNTSEDGEIANVSSDGSHVYFVSESQLDGLKGTAGQPNMYVWSGSVPDLVVPAGTIEYGPGASSTRTTPDGQVLVFESHAQLTAYNNDGHKTIYRFDDSDKSLLCVSCNPTAEPATEDARLQELTLTRMATVIHNVTEDGSRVFFETPEAMVGRDSGDVNDIYEWKEGEGGPGTVELISSGQSTEYAGDLPTTFAPRANILLSITPNGKNVVFLSQDALVPGAPEAGTPSIYTARVDGGFPAPPIQPFCLEEGCKFPSPTPPALVAPQSEATRGAGNVQRKHKPHCRRAKHKKHRHCKKQKSKQRQATRVTSSNATAQAKQALQEFSRTSEDRDAVSGPSRGSIEKVTAAGLLAAAGPFDEFGIESASAHLSDAAAGMHPDFTTSIHLNHRVNEKTGKPESDARTEEVSVALPPGLLGNIRSIPRCSIGAFVSSGTCPPDSQLGVSTVLTVLLSGAIKEPIYNLELPHPEDEIARFGFYGAYYPIFIDVQVRSASDYGVTATVHSAPGLTALLGADTTIWGNPADSSHDEERLTPGEALFCPGTACLQPEGKRSSGLDPTAFLTNPSACQDHKVDFSVKSYSLSKALSATMPLEPITDCKGLPFDPNVKAEPTNHVAGAPTGLEATLMVPQQSTEAVNEPSTATMREARVSLPEGMGIAAGAANGIAACADEQVGFRREVDAACPDASKLGTATITSPSLHRPLEGEIFQRTPTLGHQFGLWLVSDDLGLHVKIPGEIEPNKATGQLTAVFRDLPQVPVSQIDLNVWGGSRAPLRNPEQCGTYVTAYTFSPHSSDPPVAGQSKMTIDQGCGVGFSPTLRVGVISPIAGAFSPFIFDLAQGEGEQNLASLDLTLPEGLLAKLKDVSLCPDGAATTGSCPTDSKIGSLTAGVGAGPSFLWIPQPGKSPTNVYLSGPYKGAPFSIVAVVPAQAGPFDLGNVVVRSALRIDPETARATVISDPLPQFIEGVAAVYRRIHVLIDRPSFTLNPTDCSPLSAISKLTSTRGSVANPSARFQVDGCQALKFKPKLSLRLKGGTERGDYPALSATVNARKGDANIGRVSVALPHSEFLAQEHIQTICTRKRFAVDKCPKGSVYGRAKAWTPLLDQPLAGPVYLRSSDNPLPDLVMALGGELDIALVGRIDSKKGGIRTTFDTVPDAPITKFILRMRGGDKSLLVNSQNICRGVHRATVRMRAQNGRTLNSRPALKNAGCRRGG